MHKEIVSTTTNAATSAGGIASSWWLWLTDPSLAHFVTILTAILIASQLFWGWRRFFREKS
ncbi:hypothetical protein GCM10027093_21260 [Paraburkholderia jirisanensis]